MSKNKYPSLFSPQMEAIVFIILQIFFATRAVLKIVEYLTIRQRARDSQQGAAELTIARKFTLVSLHKKEKMSSNT